MSGNLRIDAGTVRRLSKRRKWRHWARTFFPKPAVLPIALGDGRGLIRLFPIMERPQHYLVFVDSKWVESEYLFREHLDEIYEAIEDYFGTPERDEHGEAVKPERDRFPVADFDGGSCWEFLHYPKGVRLCK
jgi:hypothetical protein